MSDLALARTCRVWGGKAQQRNNGACPHFSPGQVATAVITEARKLSSFLNVCGAFLPAVPSLELRASVALCVVLQEDTWVYSSYLSHLDGIHSGFYKQILWRLFFLALVLWAVVPSVGQALFASHGLPPQSVYPASFASLPLLQSGHGSFFISLVTGVLFSESGGGFQRGCSVI